MSYYTLHQPVVMCMVEQLTICTPSDDYDILLGGAVYEPAATIVNETLSEPGDDVISLGGSAVSGVTTSLDGDNSFLRLSPSGYVSENEQESSNAIPTETIISPYDMNVRMRIPSATAVCPISLDLITESQVTGFEGFALDTSSPLHSEIVLSCEHSFSASFLVVSWLTSPMRCPLCRSGQDNHLGVHNLPEMWRATGLAHIERMNQMDRDEQVRSDNAVAMQMGFNTSSVQIFMVVYFVSVDGTTQSTVVSLDMNDQEIPEDPSNDIIMRVARAHNRVIAAEIARTRCTQLNLVVFARCVGASVELVEVANSGILTVPIPEDFPGGYRNTRAHGAETRDVWVVQRSTGQGMDSESHIGLSVFSMSWTHNRNRCLDTLTGCSFHIPFVSLVGILSQMY